MSACDLGKLSTGGRSVTQNWDNGVTPADAPTSHRGRAKSTPATAKTREVSMATTQDKPTLRPDDPRHGTNVGYNTGCRSACCRHAHMVWMKKYRLYGASSTVDSLGFQRRVQALVAIGYTTRRISEELGRSKSFVDATLGQSRVRPSTHDLMAQAYERLCMTPLEGWVADRARRLAASRGYAPPLAWDDIDADEQRVDTYPNEYSAKFDDVKVRRVLDGIRQDCNQAERIAVIERWAGSLAELERLTGWNVHRIVNAKEAA